MGNSIDLGKVGAIVSITGGILFIAICAYQLKTLRKQDKKQKEMDAVDRRYR